MMSLIGTVRRNLVALIVILGLIIAGIIYHFLGRILRERFEQQASVIAITLADSAAGHVVSRDVLQLRTLVAKYGRLDGVAYALFKTVKEMWSRTVWELFHRRSAKYFLPASNGMSANEP